MNPMEFIIILDISGISIVLPDDIVSDEYTDWDTRLFALSMITVYLLVIDIIVLVGTYYFSHLI
ncbi:hypothetical protein HS7_14380 [Sulfolobales archaeon HS-7]|nr:hypothetical protein HS7_14380 [Sulfolobales archaeon HS-7]